MFQIEKLKKKRENNFNNGLGALRNASLIELTYETLPL